MTNEDKVRVITDLQETIDFNKKQLVAWFENGCSPWSSKYMTLETKIERQQSTLEFFKKDVKGGK